MVYQVMNFLCLSESMFTLLDTEYYRQTPPKVSHFLTTLFRRKLVIWFLISGVLQNYWLSGVSQSSSSVCRILLMPLPVALWFELDVSLECQHS